MKMIKKVTALFSTIAMLLLMIPVSVRAESAYTINPLTVTIEQGQITILTIAGATADLGEVTFSWWSCSSDGTISGTALGTGDSYATPTNLSAGTYYYKWTTRKDTVDITSDIATVTVTAPKATVDSVTVSPDTASVLKGGEQQFTATVNGTNNPSQDVRWWLGGKSSNNTTISSDGKLTVAADETATRFTVFADSIADDTKEGYAIVTVAVPTVDSVTVSPATASVLKGGEQQFAATVNGTNNPSQDVYWWLSGKSSNNTTISADGKLTVGEDETATSFTVIASALADETKHGETTVTVAVPTVDSVTVSPDTASVLKGGEQQFTATVNGTNNPSQDVYWWLGGKSSNNTTISADGKLTVGEDETATSFTVIASALADETKHGEATVTVTGPTVDSVTVSPATASVLKGGEQQFTATVNGTNAPSQEVNWWLTGNLSEDTTISSDGKLTVAADETAASISVVAISKEDRGKSEAVNVTVVNNAVNVTINDDGICIGGTEGYSACKVNSEDKTEITANAGYVLIISNPKKKNLSASNSNISLSNDIDIVLVNGTYDGSGYKSGSCIYITSNINITVGTYKDLKLLRNYGTISGGSFVGLVNNYGTISDGSFDGAVNNYGTISGGTFIGDGIYNNDEFSKITGGVFNCVVVGNYNGTISGGIFTSSVNNSYNITGGTFSGNVDNNVGGMITGGTFSGTVNNKGTIKGGTFKGPVSNSAGAIFDPQGTNGDAVVNIAPVNTVNKLALEPIAYEKGNTAATVSAEFSVSLKNVTNVSLYEANETDGNIVAGTPIFLFSTDVPITEETTRVTLYAGNHLPAAVLSKGSTIITFYQSYLDTLEPGTYTVAINFGRNINGEFTFTVKPSEDTYVAPDTGDRTSSSGWGIVFLASIGALFICMELKRRIS